MKFSEHWLRQLVNPAISSAELEHLLTMAGLEVEALESVAPEFSGVVVAHILSAEKHPDADRLQVCRVDVGQGEPLQIVCGAPNARAGLKAPCALVGAKLPGFDIRRAKVRGVESFGMMCSAKELGVAEESGGLLELPADAPVGQDIRQQLALDDRLFTLKLTPNRSDCLSLLGIAREVAALTGAALMPPAIVAVPVGSTQRREVRVEQPEACPRYCGRVVSGVDATVRTPDWMVQRLARSGVRSISAIVDITNYVLLELGQPMHAFDLDKLSGGIRVRLAAAGESLLLLNGQETALQPDMLVIADDDGPIALAGIMGGDASSVSDATTSIFLESAFFSPAAIAGRARRLGLTTDSSYRFERGVDFAATIQALERATQLLLEICGGSAGPVTEVCGALPARTPVQLRVARASAVLGIDLDAARVADLLARLQFESAPVEGGFRVTPPSYRFDIAIEEDLIEELARTHGYDDIPALAPRSGLHMLPDDEGRRDASQLRAALAAADYREAITYSFIEEESERALHGNAAPIALLNPIASNMRVMRSSLWAGLLEALQYNLNRRQERVRLFEVGACFAKAAADIEEVTRIAGICYGSVGPEQWGQPMREVDFYDVKADVERLAGGRVRCVAESHPALHPGQSARILLGQQAIGWIGGLHPQWQQHYQLPRGAVLFELDLAPLLECGKPQFVAVPKFPQVRRDLALVVDAALPAQAVLDTLKRAKTEVVSEISLFDQYLGKGIPQGKKSLAFLVVMQDTQQTLKDEVADAALARLVSEAAREHGAVLRS